MATAGQDLPPAALIAAGRAALARGDWAAARSAFGGALEGTVLLAASQSQGRGRMGRPFFSPADTGVYLSLLLRPKTGEAAGRVTTMAALAAFLKIWKPARTWRLAGEKHEEQNCAATSTLRDATPDGIRFMPQLSPVAGEPRAAGRRALAASAAWTRGDPAVLGARRTRPTSAGARSRGAGARRTRPLTCSRP